MVESLSKLLESIVKIPTSFVWAVVIVISVLLFAPSGVLEVLYVATFKKSYGWLLGPAWLLLSSILFVRVFHYFANRRRTKRANKVRTDQLHRLTPEEQAYIATFIIDGQNTLKVGLDDGIMGGLVAKKICFASSQMFDILEGMSFNMQPWAKEYLADRPELLQDRSGRPQTPRERRFPRW
jgi:Super-infection exclusion protein B